MKICASIRERSIFIFLFLCIFVFSMIASCVSLSSGETFVAFAKEGDKTVRVGWYESPFNSTDQSGRRSGYAYEYQLKIAAYSGWTYEYVSGSWSDLMQMLRNGEIDLLSDVSYTEERADQMLFPDLSMGTEEYAEDVLRA